MKYGGQRTWTVLGYLNNVEKGGGTKFTKLDIEISSVKGKLLIFSNVYKNSNLRKKHSELLNVYELLSVVGIERFNNIYNYL